VYYKNIFTDPTIYPSNFVYQQSLLHSKFGSFWERGYQGYIGIVYADDYDRKTFVNLGPNSFISTKNWSQNINGSIQNDVVPVIDWEINNIAPTWATKYYFVRTPNIRTENFLEWTPLLKWADENKNITSTSRYVKINKQKADLNKLQRLMQNPSPANDNELRLYAEKQADNFYTDSNWLFLADITKEIPLDENYNQQRFLANSKYISIEENGILYLLYIIDFRIKDALSPLEFEKEKIKDIILYQRKLKFLKDIQNSLYQKASKGGEIKYYLDIK
jgi:hypothetical protein